MKLNSIALRTLDEILRSARVVLHQLVNFLDLQRSRNRFSPQSRSPLQPDRRGRDDIERPPLLRGEDVDRRRSPHRVNL